MSRRLEMGKITSASWTILLVLTFALLSCNKASDNVASPNTFISPEAAGKALVEAARSGNQGALLAMFGPSAKDLIYSGDATEDKEGLAGFASAYEQMNRWRELDDKTEVLIVGADNNVFPIPLEKNNEAQWYFDTEAGRNEMLARRIGRNELAAIEVCDALVEAQGQYFSQGHDGQSKQYAMKFISSSGRRDGLYWESPADEPKSPMGPLVADAAEEGYNVQTKSQAPFHGYQFRMLEKQGSHAEGGQKNYVLDGKMVNGFAFIAVPAAYGTSGIMTFIVNQNGMVYQKDLGKTTAATAGAIDEFDPDESWSPVED